MHATAELASPLAGFAHATAELASPLLAVLIALTAVLKHARGTALCRSRTLARTPLVAAGPAPARLMLACACAAVGAAYRTQEPALGLALLGTCVALCIDTRFTRLAPLGERWRPLRALDHLRATRARPHAWLDAGSWLDATTPCGAALLASTYVLAWLIPGAARDALFEGALVVTPLFLTATRWQLPVTADAALLTLARAQAQIASESGEEGEIAVRVDARDRAVDAQLRFRVPDALPGFESLALVVADTRWLDRDRHAAAWLARAIDDSPADAALASALPGARRYHQGNRVAYLATAPRPTQELSALRSWLRAPAVLQRAA